MLLTCSEARILWPYWNTRCIFIDVYQCNASFLQSHFANALNSIPYSGIKECWLGGFTGFKEVVFSEYNSDFQLKVKTWSALLVILLFVCPMCYRMQAQGGTSSSMHLAGATNICFPEELTCKCCESFHIWKVGWCFGCLSKPLPWAIACVRLECEQVGLCTLTQFFDVLNTRSLEQGDLLEPVTFRSISCLLICLFSNRFIK